MYPLLLKALGLAPAENEAREALGSILHILEFYE